MRSVSSANTRIAAAMAAAGAPAPDHGRGRGIPHLSFVATDFWHDAIPRGMSIRSAAMLTKHPNIVIALPPKRATRRKKAAALHANLPRIVDAQKPSPRKPAKAAPILTSRIADHSKPSPLDEFDHEAAGAAADRLWQEIVQGVKAAAQDQPALGRKNSRTKSGQ